MANRLEDIEVVHNFVTQTLNTTKEMKKLFAFALVAGMVTLAACSSKSGEATATDSTAADTTVVADTAAADTAAADSAAAPADTVKK